MSIKTIQEFRDRIEEGVNADITDLPKGQSVAWFAPPGSNTATMFRVLSDVPFDAYSTVIALFDQGDSITAYTLPKAPPELKPADWKVTSPCRYTLTKTAPTYLMEVMTIDAMADLIVDEWNLVADTMSSAEAEREAIADWLSSQPSTSHATGVAEIIRSGEYAEEDEEEDDAPESSSTPTTNGAAPPSAPAIPAEVVK
jgi:hypothetical protein